MNPTVKTVLPLITWTLRRAFGPVFEPSVWRAIALSFIPPPGNIVNVLNRESAGYDTRGFLSASQRRRIRKRYKRYFTKQLSNNTMYQATLNHLLELRQMWEAEGCTADPTRIRKLENIQEEVDEYYSSLIESYESESIESYESESIVPGLGIERSPDAFNLLWEFAVYGESDRKPMIRKDSVAWKDFGLDPMQLKIIAPADGLITLFSRFEALLGLVDGKPDEYNLRQLLKWIIRTHLPPEKEPKTTPHAISMAINEGLIYKGIEGRDNETGEITEVQVEDPRATDFVVQVEERDELNQIISQVELSPGEQLVLEGMRAGYDGSDLQDWVGEKGTQLSRGSVPVLASKVRNKLRKAAKS